MKLSNYLQEVKSEMTHVNFPSQKTTIIFGLLVVLISVLVAIYLGFFDYIFNMGVERLLSL